MSRFSHLPPGVLVGTNPCHCWYIRWVSETTKLFCVIHIHIQPTLSFIFHSYFCLSSVFVFLLLLGLVFAFVGCVQLAIWELSFSACSTRFKLRTLSSCWISSSLQILILRMNLKRWWSAAFDMVGMWFKYSEKLSYRELHEFLIWQVLAKVLESLCEEIIQK